MNKENKQNGIKFEDDIEINISLAKEEKILKAFYLKKSTINKMKNISKKTGRFQYDVIDDAIDIYDRLVDKTLKQKRNGKGKKITV